VSAPRPARQPFDPLHARRDADAMRRVAAGDLRGLRELYERHATRVLFPLALVILRDRAEAEDIVHDAFVGLVDRAGRYTSSLGTVEGWLIALVRNLAIDRMRRCSRRGAIEHGALVHEPQEVVLSPEQRLSLVEQCVRVRVELESLSPAQREAVAAAFFDDLSYGEIAERERIPLGTVKSRVNRGLGLLRASLG
jgi:RNA polymerase sigma-70 factor (ECF subfamily)